MRLDVKFVEQNASFEADFGEVNNISDGGYERGYAEGAAVGKAEGYTEGFEAGAKAENITAEVTHDYELFQYCLRYSHSVGDTLTATNYPFGDYYILGYKLPLGCTQINISDVYLNQTFAMGEAKRCIVLVKGYTSEGGGTCAVATDDVVVTPTTTGKGDYIITVPEGLGIDGVYLGTSDSIPVLSVIRKSEAYVNGYNEGYTEGYTKAESTNPFYYATSLNNICGGAIFPENYEAIIKVKKAPKNSDYIYHQATGYKSSKLISEDNTNVIAFNHSHRVTAYTPTLELVDLTEYSKKFSSLAEAFRGQKKLKSVLGALDLSECTNVTNVFFECSALEDVEFVPNTVKISIMFTSCSKLTKASITSIINGLATDTSGNTVTLSKTAVNIAFGSTESVEWLALVATKPNWTISLT